MSIFKWCARRAPGLSIITLVTLSYWAIMDALYLPIQSPLNDQSEVTLAPKNSFHTDSIWTYLFAYYTLFIHVLVVMFPIRACLSVWEITRSLRNTSRQESVTELKQLSNDRRVSISSVTSSETLASKSSANSSTVTAVALSDVDLYPDDKEDFDELVIRHAIVIPNYKEEIDTLRETLEVLASHPQASECYDVYLAMEIRESGSESKALSLIQQFSGKFSSIDYTLHPSDISGEAAGKGSNMAWAARKLSTRYPMHIRKDVIVTGIDSDSHLSAHFFTLLSNMHICYPDTAATTLYSAPIIFDRNAHMVPAVVRVADVLWSAAGMSGLYQSSVIAPPTSCYSLPLVLIDRVGGWDCDSEAIGEDLHMFIKCFFAVNGHLTCRTVLAPISSSNVTAGKGNGFRGVMADVKARYQQALRHMWGALDTGYALCKIVELWQEKGHTVRAFRPLHQNDGTESTAFIPQAPLDGSDIGAESGIFSDMTVETLQDPHWQHIFYLCHRLFEAHFLTIHMTILVVTTGLYLWAVDGKEGAGTYAWIWTTSNVLRAVGFILSVCYLVLYERLHQHVVSTREKEMTEAGLNQTMHFSYRSLRKNFVDYLMVPVVAPLYGAFPLAQAELAHLWAHELNYTVSQKVTRLRSRSNATAARVPPGLV